MRKSFAQRLYDQTADIFAIQELLGHKFVATTQRYLGVNYASVREAVEKMAFSASEREIDALSPQMLKTTSDAALLLELAMRGYDLSLLRNTYGLLSETTSQIHTDQRLVIASTT